MPYMFCTAREQKVYYFQQQLQPQHERLLNQGVRLTLPIYVYVELGQK